MAGAQAAMAHDSPRGIAGSCGVTERGRVRGSRRGSGLRLRLRKDSALEAGAEFPLLSLRYAITPPTRQVHPRWKSPCAGRLTRNSTARCRSWYYTGSRFTARNLPFQPYRSHAAFGPGLEGVQVSSTR
jgi:hypothetical protein